MPSYVPPTPPRNYPPIVDYDGLNWGKPEDVPEEIPVVDVSQLNTDEDLRQFFHDIQKSGFFYIKNHGINRETLIDVLNAHRSCVSVSDEELQKVVTENIAIKGGVEVFGSCCCDRFAHPEKKNKQIDPMVRIGYNAHDNLSPNEQYKKATQKYFNEMNALGERIARKIIDTIPLFHPEFDKAHFDGYFGSKAGLLYSNFYPQMKKTDPRPDYHRLADHRDLSICTLLHQLPMENGRSSLYAFVEGEKKFIPPIKDQFLVNLGQVLSYATNGLFEAVRHGVAFPEKDEIEGSQRMSIAFFYLPASLDLLIKKDKTIEPERQRTESLIFLEQVIKVDEEKGITYQGLMEEFGRVFHLSEGQDANEEC